MLHLPVSSLIRDHLKLHTNVKENNVYHVSKVVEVLRDLVFPTINR